MALTYLLNRKGMYLYPWYISDITSTADIKEIAGTNIAKMFVTIEDDFLTMYYDEPSGNEIGKKLLEKILSEPDFFETVVKNIYQYGDELIAFCKSKAVGDLSKLSDEELLKIYEEYIARLRTLRMWGWIPVFVDGLVDGQFLSEHVVSKFKAYLNTLGSAEKASAYYSLLSSSEKESEVQREEAARLALAYIIETHPEGKEAMKFVKAGDAKTVAAAYPQIQDLLTKHIEKFGSLTYGYSGPAMTVEYLLNALADDLSKGKIEKRIAEIHEHYLTVKEEKEELTEKLKLPEELQYAFRVSSELMYMKDWRKGAYQESYLLMDTVIDEIARRLTLTVKEIKYLLLLEVRAALLEGKRDEYANKLKERVHNCCYVTEGGQITIYEGAAICQKLKQELVEPPKSQNLDVKELKGMTAYAGIVRGTVKIVLTVEDVSKVNEGDILVSSATNPDLILAMKKAGAFVTDSGGIISHAAIVSRELKKPCVVGTRIATQVLKDGDMVEVDANAGVVRILERHG